MSTAPYPLFSVSEKDRPEDVEKRIKLLVRLYLCHHDKEIAVAVVRHVNAILAYPHYINDLYTRCQLRHLAEHWRCLGWIDIGEPQDSQPRKTLQLKQIMQLQK